MGTSGWENNCIVLDKTGRRLSVIYRRISDLKLPTDNPRDHTPRQLRRLGRSIGSFGFITPVVTGADDNVIAGVGRVLAALHPHYVDTIVRRWQRYTGEETLHADTGKSFHQREAEEGNGK